MKLTERYIPAREERQSWEGSTRFNLSGVSYLKIESPGVEHLNLQVPDGDTYSIEMSVNVVKN